MNGRILSFARQWMGFTLRSFQTRVPEVGVGRVTHHRMETGQHVKDSSVTEVQTFFEGHGFEFKETGTHFILELPKDAFNVGEDS